MKAYVVETPDGPFRETEVSKPKPLPGHVLVKISASCVNPLDTKIRAGKAGHAKQPLPAVLGLDMAGVVEKIGEGVTSFRIGDEVFGMVGGVGGHQGTLAEHISADAALLAPKPNTLSMLEAAALPLVAITAWEGLVDRAKVLAGQTVLVHAGTGGVGFAAIQIALAFGAKVYATVSPSRRALIEEIGTMSIDCNQAVEAYVQDCTRGEGFDIIYDTLGGSVLDASFAAVKRYTGHVVSCLGWGTHALAPLSFRAATYSGVFTLLPLLSGVGRAHHGEILREISKLAEKNQMRPLLAAEHFGRNDIAAAYEQVANGSKGKVVVQF
jgi:NADPH2:quinone reductase